MITRDATILLKSIIFFLMVTINGHAAEPGCPNGSNPNPSIIWCDSFEDEDLGPGNSVGENYYDFSPGSDPENMVRINSESIHGNYSLKNHWNAGAGLSKTGSFMRTFGRNPVSSLSHSTQDFDNIYWRFYVKLQNGFSGQPNKLSRATIFAGPGWEQAIIAHLWSPANGPLNLDPASGIDETSSQLVTTGWNDFANLHWLGMMPGSTTLVPGTWYCVEAHIKLNTLGQSNGVFEYWRDDVQQAGRGDYNWRSSWNAYGINTIMFSDYWNETSSKEQERYLDAIVISKQRIGCLGTSVAAPKPPTNISAQ